MHSKGISLSPTPHPLEDIEGLNLEADSTELLSRSPGKEGNACVVLVCSQLALLVFSSSSTSLQILIFINGNKVVTYLVILVSV